MSSDSVNKIDVAQLVPNAIGMLVFDENCNVIDASGVGKQRLEDIVAINQVEVDNEGFGALKSADTLVVVYKQNGKTVAVYTAKK
ncbi:LANO_0A01332g1_1 [Lachancea nothofagi CBS 11611]|uniref:LANO_0A01332g1_1 n=1 Tax=Lachancea nothofagi CBS 11611 TaxID=1266666 RepID=A0A1G4IME2_9SACH|nr:LANO_0A01332g1_1 [Lachancea nothofagi CBS 11611]